MITETMVDRREFLKAGVSGSAALILGFHMPNRGRAQSVSPGDAGGLKPNAWLRITTDNQITVWVENPEMGQGPRTTATMLLADELEADWSKIRVEQAPVLPDIYHHLHTGGSGGTGSEWTYMRQAGAQAREMLLTAAAQQWNVPQSECQARQSTVIHAATNRRSTYGQLVEAASKLPPIKADGIALKPPQEYRIIGKPLPRVDVPCKVDGSGQFGIDVRVPGMLFAVIARCPQFEGNLVNFDSTAARAIPGVRAVFSVPPIGQIPITPGVARNIRCAGGVAVVADSTWAAIKGREALKISWDKGSADESTATLQKLLKEQAWAPPSYVAVNQGDALRALENSPKRVEATYELPFQAHATMEPMNTTVSVRDDRIEVWSPSQIGEVHRNEIAHLSGLPPEKVTVHMTLCGGSFGRRYQWDYAAEAWQVAKEMKQPVQLVWTREDDMQHDFYRPYSYHRMRGALDERGGIEAWYHRIVSTPIRTVFDSPESLQDPKHVASQELSGANVIPYTAASFRLDFAPADSVVPRAWWRSVESSFNGFAVECFVDELAHAAGRDPYEYRLSLVPEGRKLGGDEPLDTSRLRAVLKLAGEKAGWGKPLPPGHGRGIAGFYGFNSYIAEVAEVSVEKDGAVRVNRIVCAVDCGTAVNPDGVRAMAESAINYALTPVLTGEITIKDGAAEQSNFHEYQVLRMNQAPDIEVHIVPSTENPGGMGEPGVPPLAPAVANAVFAATDVRIRRLPIDTKLLAKAT